MAAAPSSFTRVMGSVPADPAHPPRKKPAAYTTEPGRPPPYVDYSKMFNVPVLRIEATLPAERVEYDETFASDDEVTR
jgi:hypothetical protein